MKIFWLVMLMFFMLGNTEAKPFWKKSFRSQKCKFIGINKLNAYQSVSKAQIKREKKAQEKWQKNIKPSFVKAQ